MKGDSPKHPREEDPIQDPLMALQHPGISLAASWSPTPMGRSAAERIEEEIQRALQDEGYLTYTRPPKPHGVKRGSVRRRQKDVETVNIPEEEESVSSIQESSGEYHGIQSPSHQEQSEEIGENYDEVIEKLERQIGLPNYYDKEDKLSRKVTPPNLLSSEIITLWKDFAKQAPPRDPSFNRRYWMIPTILKEIEWASAQEFDGKKDYVSIAQTAKRRGNIRLSDPSQRLGRLQLFFLKFAFVRRDPREAYVDALRDYIHSLHKCPIQERAPIPEPIIENGRWCYNCSPRVQILRTLTSRLMWIEQGDIIISKATKPRLTEVIWPIWCRDYFEKYEAQFPKLTTGERVQMIIRQWRKVTGHEILAYAQRHLHFNWQETNLKVLRQTYRNAINGKAISLNKELKALRGCAACGGSFADHQRQLAQAIKKGLLDLTQILRPQPLHKCFYAASITGATIQEVQRQLSQLRREMMDEVDELPQTILQCAEKLEEEPPEEINNPLAQMDRKE